MALTAIRVKNEKTPGRHADGSVRGLYLLVKPTGGKSWVLRVVIKGRRCDLGLGGADVVSLEEVRDKAREWRKLAKAGINPAEEAKRGAEAVPTFAVAAVKAYENKLPSWKNTKHVGQWIGTLRKYAFPVLGKLPVDQIDAKDIWAALGSIWQSKPETARRVNQRIASVLNYAKAHDWRPTEAPASAVRELTPKQRKKRGHFEALPYAELPAVVAELRSRDLTVGRAAVLFNLYTVARPGNVTDARRSEIDWESGEWRIGDEGMKMGRAHVVPLMPEALDLLREIWPLSSGDDGLIFPGMKKGKGISDAAMRKEFRKCGAGTATVHGARSSFRDWVAEQTSMPGEWAEAALSHDLKDKTEAAYLRTKYLEQRRTRLMPAWIGFLTGNSNVVALAERRA